MRVWSVICVYLYAYFSFMICQGGHGMSALLWLVVQVEKAEAVQARVQAEREVLHDRVFLLRADHLDPDMLEERARVMLKFVRPDEIVILGKWAGRRRHPRRPTARATTGIAPLRNSNFRDRKSTRLNSSH